MTELAKWDSFYGILGSAAATLIGLQFVVMTLVAERPSIHSAAAGAAFATPTIVHFCAVLLLSALLRAPWDAVAVAAVIVGLMGFSGVVYTAIVTRRMRKQAAYKPVFEDWLFHAVLPLIAYVVLSAAGFAAVSWARVSLFGVGAAALLLLLSAIHNAWDAVAYHVLVQRAKANTERQPEKTAGKEI